MRTSAVRNCTTKLGRASTKCESSVGFAITVTATLSPPTSRASEPKSGRVATTLSFACAEKRHRKVTDRINRIFFIKLKLMRAVGAEDEFELKKDRVDVASGQEKCFVEKIMIVLEPDL